MFLLKIYALFLITSPIDLSETIFYNAQLDKAIHEVAISYEFSTDKEWSHGRLCLQHFRYLYSLGDDLPPSWAINQFVPASSWLGDAEEMNFQYRMICVTMYETEGGVRREDDVKWWKEAEKEAEDIVKIYRMFRLASSENIPIGLRRLYLKDLRDKIGCYDFWGGKLPPPIPVNKWRIVR